MNSIILPIARNLSWLTVGEIAVRGAFLLFVLVLARGLGAAAVGVFTVAAGVALVAVTLFTCGQAEVLMRSVAREPERARSLLAGARRGQRWALVVGVPVALAGLLLVGDRSLAWTLLSLGPYILLRVEVFTRGAVFKGLDRMEVEVGARVLELAVALTLLITAVAAEAPVWAAGIALSIGAAASLGWMLRHDLELPRAERSVPPESAAAQLARGLPFLGLAVGLQLLLRSDTFLAAGFEISAEAIGRYGAAAGLTWGSLAIPQFLAISLYPTFSRSATDRRSPGPSTLAAAAIGLAVGTVGAVGLSGLAGPLLGILFGAEFRSGAPLLGRLAWALPGASASMVMGVVLAAWHRQSLALAWLTGIVALSVTLNLFLIPREGLHGAATTAVVAHSLGAAGNLVLGLVRYPQR